MVTTIESVETICARFSIHMVSAVPVPENPHFNITGQDGGNTHHNNYMRHFHCIAGMGDRTIESYFSVGIGIIERWIIEFTHLNDLSMAERSNLKMGRHVMDNESPRSEYWLTGFEQAAKYYKPPIDMLISGLSFDCLTLAYGQDFTEWCEELGYDDDSISARKCFDNCCDHERKLRHFIGNNDLFDELLEAAGRE